MRNNDSLISSFNAHGPLVNHTGLVEDLRWPTFNKRPMDHIAHLRNFQTINTFMQRFEYTITLIKREVPWSLWELNVSQGCFEPSLVENDQLVVEKEILSECFLYLNIISPWKKHYPSFEQSQISFTQGFFVSNLVEIGPVVLEKIIQFCQCFFSISLLSSFEKKTMTLHLNKIKFLLPKDALCQIWYKKWPSGSGENYSMEKTIY